MCLIYILGSKCVLERYVNMISIHINILSYIHHSVSQRKRLLPGCNIPCDYHVGAHYLHPLFITRDSHMVLQGWLLYILNRETWQFLLLPTISSNVLTFGCVVVVKWVLLFSFAFLWFLLKWDISSHTCYPFRFFFLLVAYSFDHFMSLIRCLIFLL